MDMSLPGALINCAFRESPPTSQHLVINPASDFQHTELGSCIASVALSVNAVGYFGAVLPFVLLVLYGIQKFYLRTSRQLRLLE